MPKLSELPDFLPLGEKGSPELHACAVGTFTDREANLDFMRLLMRDYRASLSTNEVTASAGQRSVTPLSLVTPEPSECVARLDQHDIPLSSSVRKGVKNAS